MVGIEYDSNEKRELDVLGEKFVIKSLPGVDYLDLVGKCSNALTGEINRRKYTIELFNACIVSPKKDPVTLSTPATLILFSEIENMLGVAELMRKNLLRMPGTKV